MDQDYQNNSENIIKKSLTLKLSRKLFRRASIIQEIEEECNKVETGLRKLHKLRQKKFLISQASTPKGFWDSFILLLILYSATVMPYNVAFPSSYSDEIFFYILDSVIDFIFVIDMALSLFSEIIDKNNNIVNDRKIILISYLKNRFLIDLAMNFPYQILEYSFEIREARFLRFIKSSRIIRISSKLNKLTDLISRFLVISNLTVNLIMWFVVLCLFVHFTACLWGNLTDAEYDYNTWTVYYNINNQDIASIYLASAYWVSTTIFTVGFGDIIPVSQREKIFAICTMGIGVFFFSYIISTTNLSQNLRAKKNYHLENNLRYLQLINKKFNIPQAFYSKIEQHIKYNLETTRKDHTQFAASLSARLSQQLIFVMHKKLVDENLFFQDKAEAFIRAVVIYLMPLKVSIDDKVFIQGDLANELYFLTTGVVEFYNECGGFEIVETNDYFGDAEIFHKEYREFNVRAVRKCEILLIEHISLLRCMSQFEEIKISVITIALEKYALLYKNQNLFRDKFYQVERNEYVEVVRCPSENQLENGNLNMSDNK